MLSRRVGLEHIETVEDAVQAALIKALEAWTTSGLPENPSAWLYRVAHNDLMGELRQQSSHQRILARNPDAAPGILDEGLESPMDGEVEDDLLRMLFVCCDECLPAESQLVFALKILCGFSVREISLRLFISEANVYKRLSRARRQLQKNPPELEFPSGCKPDELTAGRPERDVSSFGAIDHPRLPLIEILDPQLPLRSLGGEGDVLAAGRDSDVGTVGIDADTFRRRKGKLAQGGFRKRLLEMDERDGQRNESSNSRDRPRETQLPPEVQIL